MSKILPIIVVNYNGLDDTIKCVESIMRSTIEDFKIYLVDNKSEGSDSLILSEKFSNNPKIKLILNTQNLGFGKAHNKVVSDHIQNLSWDYVALINNDAEVHKDCLRNAIESADKENVDVLSMKMIDYQDHNLMDSAGHKVLTNGEILPVGKNADTRLHDQSSLNIGASGGACLYKRSCIEEIGFFDPHFFVGYEDAELGMRAFVTGYKCMYCPDAIVYHKGGQTIKKVFDNQYAIQTFKNIRYTNYKLLPWPILIVIAPLKLIRLLLIIITCLISLRWSTAVVLIKALVGFYINDLGKAMAARKALRKKTQILSTLKVLKSMNSTILHDLRNFYSIFVRKKPSAIDQYR